MPFDVKKDNRCPLANPWGVVNSDTNKLHGCHPSADAAREQQKALYANTPDANSLRDRRDITDPDQILASLDATLDAALLLIATIDRVTASPAVNQLCDTVAAANVICDDLMEAMSVPDPDDDDEGDEADMYDEALGLPYIIKFDYRSDGGPLMVGPFPTREACRAHCHMLEPFESEYQFIPISRPWSNK